MESDQPTAYDRLDEYRETCRREGELMRELRALRFNKCRIIGELNHAIGNLGKHERDAERGSGRHIDIEPDAEALIEAGADA